MTAACTDEARRAESRERGRMRSPSAGAETASWRADAADSSVPPRLARPWRGMEVRLARAALVLSHAKRSRVTASDTNCEPKAAATARKAWSASSRRSIKSTCQFTVCRGWRQPRERIFQSLLRCGSSRFHSHLTPMADRFGSDWQSATFGNPNEQARFQSELCPSRRVCLFGPLSCPFHCMDETWSKRCEALSAP